MMGVLARANLPMWVTPAEARGVLESRHYAEAVADELAEWMARRMSLSFLAGYLGHRVLPISVPDVERQLEKMGYCTNNAREIASLMSNLHPLLHQNGCERGVCRTH